MKKFVSNPAIYDNKVIGLDEAAEPPDFSIKTLENGLISVEITELYNQKLKQRQEFQDKIIALAEHKFLERYGTYLRVFVTFSNIAMKGSLNNLDSFRDLIFDYVEDVYLNNRSFNFRVTSRKKSQLSKYFEKFSIDNDINFSNWQSFSAFKVDYADPKWILERIQKKEKGLLQYEKNYSQNWLLLVSGFGSKASAFRFEHLLNKPVNTNFDRVFIYEYFQDIVHEVNLL